MDWNEVDTSGLLQLAIEAFPNGVLLIDAQSKVALINHHAQEQFGYTQAEFLGIAAERLLPEAAEPLQTAQAKAIALAPRGEAAELTTTSVGVSKDGRRFPIELRLRPLRTAQLTGVLAAVVVRAAPTEPVPVAAVRDPIDERREQELSEAFALRRARRAVGASHATGLSPASRRVMELVEQVAETNSTVLLLGETGTGKEVFASRIHELGARRHRPMVRVNCAAIPSTLIESELFGREKGAFTGALARQVGRFELADKATIFLDEIGDLPLDVQVKLLRVLEEGQIERLGSPQAIKVDARIIAATHQDLQQRMNDGAFREDLFYRLNVFPIRVPPLRERVEDIPGLVWQFVNEFAKTFGKRVDSISPESIKSLQQYPWPGNIRELRNIVERATIVATGPHLTITVPPNSNTAARRSLKLVDVERQHMRAVLESTHWRIRGEGGAAARLGLKPTTLETRMARLGLRRPDRR